MAQPPGYDDHTYLQPAIELLAAFTQRNYELMRIEADQTLLGVSRGPGKAIMDRY